jgi:hypothetical protein
MVVILGPLQRGATQRLASGVSRRAVCRDGGGDSRVDTLARRSSGVRRSRRDKTAVFGVWRRKRPNTVVAARDGGQVSKISWHAEADGDFGTSAGTPHQDKRR